MRASVAGGQLVFLTALALATPAGAQQQPNGLLVKEVHSPAPGRVQVLLAAQSPHDAAIGQVPQAKDFTVWLADGAARDVSAIRNSARGKPLTTVILVDESGSYKRFAGTSQALPAVRAYVGSMATTDRMGLMVFSAHTTPFAFHSTASEVEADLDKAESRPTGQVTNLYRGLDNAIVWAATEGAPWLREVILFTDAGDEATTIDWSALRAKAIDNGVRISVAVPSSQREPRGSNRERWLDAINNLSKLADETSGLFDDSGDGQVVERRFMDARTEARNWLVLEGSLCGLKPGQPNVGVRVDYTPQGSRQAWSADSFLATATLAAGSEQPCPAYACSPSSPCASGALCRAGKCEAVCQPACEAWQECEGTACAPRACSTPETCGARATCTQGLCALLPAVPSKGYLPWIIGGLLALLALLGFLWRRKQQQPLAAELPSPPVVAPGPPIARPMVAPAPPIVLGSPRAEAGPTGIDPVLDPLPETHLRAMRGWPTQGQLWRLTSQKTRLGGSRAPADKNDIVLEIDQISGQHAMIELYRSGDLWITDLGSSNGTFINQRKLKKDERAALKVGDQVGLSQHLLLEIVRPGVEPVKPKNEPLAGGNGGSQQQPGKPNKRTTFDRGNR